MRNRYPPLLPLQEGDADPRAASAAALLTRLKAPPSLPPSANARIELQLRRGLSPSSRPEMSRGLRWARSAAVVAGIFVALGGSAFATYRAPEMARAIRSYLSKTTERWAASLRGPSTHRAEETRDPVSQSAAPSALPLEALQPPKPSMATPSIPAPMIASGPGLAHRHASRRPVPAPSPSPSWATAAPVADGLSVAVRELERGLAQKRAGNLAQADAIFGGYRAAHPDGPLAQEAALDQLDAALALDRQSEALELLDMLSADGTAPRASELRLLRGEVQARLGQCDQALATLSGTFATPDLAERALYGRASCLQRLGRVDESRRAFAELLVRFPNGALTTQASQALGKLQ